MRRNYRPSPEDLALAEKIKADSLKRPLGSLVKCCPLQRYTQRKITENYVIGCLLLVVMSVLLATANWGKISQDYGESLLATTCTTLSSNTTGSLSCEGCRSGGCLKFYPCLVLTVSYQADLTHVTNATLSESRERSEKRQCMVDENECHSEDPSHAVTYYQDRFGSPGTRFSCFYDPDNIKDVFYKQNQEGNDSFFSWIRIVGPAIGAFVGLVLILFTFCVCGCACCSKVNGQRQCRLAGGQGVNPASNNQQYNMQPPPQQGIDSAGFSQNYSSVFQTQNYGLGGTENNPPPYAPNPPAYNTLYSGPT